MKTKHIGLLILVLGLIAGGAYIEHKFDIAGWMSGSRTEQRPVNATPVVQNVAETQNSTRPSDDISVSRQNAITRTVAVASPAVVGINVIEERNNFV